MKKETVKMISNIILFLCLIFFTFFFIFKDQNINGLINIINSTNKVYLICGVLTMFLFFFFESLNIKYVLNVYNNKVSIFKALKYTFIGNFFSAITPASSGGQPMEIYYMTKDGIPAEHGTIALIIELCGYHISSLIIGLICVFHYPVTIEGGLYWLLIIGFIIKGSALTLMLVLIFSKRATSGLIKVVKWFISLFNFRDIDIKHSKLDDSLSKYEESAKFIKENKKIFVKSLVYATLQIIFLHLVNYFVYRSFGLNTLSVFELFAMQAVLFCMVSGIPLPGAVGISEMTYLRVYEIAYGASYASSAMLLARGINFYSYVIISLLIVIINHIVVTKKTNKVLK